MNTKIEKLRAERSKNEEKIQQLKEKNHELDKKISHLENLEIVGAIRSLGLTLEELDAFVHTGVLPPQEPQNATHEDENETHPHMNEEAQHYVEY